MEEKKTFKISPRATKVIVYTATIVNLILWFDYIEQMFYACCDDGFYLYFTFLIISGILFLLSVVFYRIASLGAKIVMYLCYAFIVFNVFLGILNKYWVRDLERFSESEKELLFSFANGDTCKLPANMKILYASDSLIIIGRQANLINKSNFTASEIILPDSLREPISLYYDYRYKILVPSDFKSYYSLITGDDADLKDNIISFYSWAYPEYILFVYVPHLPSYYSERKRKIQLPFYFIRTFEINKRDNVINFSWELVHGELPKRYKLFFGKFKELFFPTYVSTDMKNDPYFLIFEGKYKEAREGLKDLPPARREFCEKKLEALGY